MAERAPKGSSASAVARVVDPLDVRHLGPESLRRYLAANGLRPNCRYSQNFLADASVLEAIVAAAALDAPVPLVANAVGPGPDTRQVLEIGPGIGILTGALLAAGAQVVAVEVDPRMVDHLRRRFADAIADTTLRLVHDDILERAVGDLVAEPWDLIANVPYHITSPILHHVLGDEPRPDRFVLMVQREVAERIAAPPGGMSYLSVFVQYHADVSILQVVPASAFEPAPEVDSALLVGRTRARRLDAEGEERLWRVVQAGFRERRKMLHNVLPRQLPWLGRERIEAALLACDIAPDRRPQTLSVEAWMALAAAIGPLEAVKSPVVDDAAGGRPPIATRAHAKVNLALAVIGRRTDGFHDLVSVFARLDLADELMVESTSGPDRLEMADGSIAHRPAADDLVLQSAALLRTAHAPGASGLIFRLTKHVPLAAGLGGGSADAAAVLDLAARAWGLALTAEERQALAARLGSDVPFFAADVDAALVTGRGEHLEPLPGPLDPLGVLLVTSGTGLSTEAVFESMMALAASAGRASRAADAALAARDLAARLAAGCAASDLVAMAARLRDANDLWPAAIRLRPDLVDLRTTLEARLDRPLLLSGSGPTVLALYPSRADADAAANVLRSDPPFAVPAAAIRSATFEGSKTREAR